MSSANESAVKLMLPPPFEWCEIPAGKVTIINTWRDESYVGEEGEAKTFDVAKFYISKYPITNAQFSLMVNDGGYLLKQFWTEAGYKENFNFDWRGPLSWGDARFNGAEQPVCNICWYEAVTFCQWLSYVSGEEVMLPSDKQWQRAARGDDARVYPWGNEWDASQCNHNVDQQGIGSTTPVRQFEGKDESPFGVVDMAGNVSEYCSTIFETGSDAVEGDAHRIMCGGSWNRQHPLQFRVDEHSWHYITPYEQNVNRGFRIVCAYETLDEDNEQRTQARTAAKAKLNWVSAAPRLATTAKASKAQSIPPPPFEWCEIPAGKVTLAAPINWWRDREPSPAYGVGETFELAAFDMAKYPITNAQFAKFIEAGGYQEKKWWLDAGWQHKETGNWTAPRWWDKTGFNHGEQPVMAVSWFEAVAFCKWLSEVSGEAIMLPTEAQWQRAAQGDDGRAYAWGNEWAGDKCNNTIYPQRSNFTTAVTQYEALGNVSPFGVVDMTGNVDEWCLTTYATGSNDLSGLAVRVLRGGCYYVGWEYGSVDYFRVDYRENRNPAEWSSHTGFRITRA